MAKKVLEIQETVEPAYTLRALAAKDIFPMANIISKIGINEFTKALDSEAVKRLVLLVAGREGEAENENKITAIGITVALDIANSLLSHLGDCEQEIYTFLCGLSGKGKEELMEMPMNTFLEMVVDVFKKEEFRGFIGVVSRLVK